MMGIVIYVLSIISLLFMGHGESADYNKVFFDDIDSLTFKAGEYTKAGRGPPSPQLTRMGGAVRDRYIPSVVNCTRLRGDDHWKCTADMPSAYQFGTTMISCETYYYNDTYIIEGTCYLGFDLEYAPKDTLESANQPDENFEFLATILPVSIIVIIFIAAVVYFKYSDTRDDCDSDVLKRLGAAGEGKPSSDEDLESQKLKASRGSSPGVFKGALNAITGFFSKKSQKKTVEITTSQNLEENWARDYEVHDEIGSSICRSKRMKGAVVVTGFGPFGPFSTNPSSEIVDRIAELGIPDFNGTLITEKLNVNYDEVQEAVDKLWGEAEPALVVHIGVHPYVHNTVLLEQQAFRNGYCRYDVKGCVPDNNTCGCHQDEILKCSMDLDGVARSVNKILNDPSVIVELSDDPGRYLCGYIYFHSLSKKNDRSLFIHVSSFDETCTLEKETEAVRQVIRELLARQGAD